MSETTTTPTLWIGPNGEAVCSGHARRFSQQLHDAIVAGDTATTDRGTWVTVADSGLECEFCG